MFLNLQKLSCRRIIGVVGSKHMEYLPDIIPCLLHLLNDEAPPVVRQAIKTGTTLFAKLIQRLVIQVIPFPTLAYGAASLHKFHFSFLVFGSRDYSPLGGLMMPLNRHGSGCSNSNLLSLSWHFRRAPLLSFATK